MDNLAFLRELLPAGEWSDIKVRAPGGMMQSRQWAVLAEAVWIRNGGIPAFIKFIRTAGPTAGSQTRWVTGAERLEHLEERLSKIRELSSVLPLVPLLDLRLIPDKGLLIGMEKITPLQNMIEFGETVPNLPAKILCAFDFSTRQNDLIWHHFDICPRNIGIKRDGEPVFIDIESLYLLDGNHFSVTVPAYKADRLPVRLQEQLLNNVRPAGNTILLPRDLAAEKYKFEILLASAETALGEIGPILGRTLEHWFTEWPNSPASLQFQSGFRELRDRPHAFSLSEFAAKLGSMPTQVDERRAAVPAAPSTDKRKAVVNPVPISESRSHAVSSDMSGLVAEARALRRGELTEKALLSYIERLRFIISANPKDRSAWEELLFIAVTYQRNADEARTIVDSALVALEDDKSFNRWKAILSMWRNE